MRNQVAMTVSKSNCGLAVHFCNPEIDNRDFKPKMEMEIRKGQVEQVFAPHKLQGSDFNLRFPLHVTKNHAEVDFGEIERILILNQVAQNVVRIEKRPNGDERHQDYLVIFNEN